MKYCKNKLLDICFLIMKLCLNTLQTKTPSYAFMLKYRGIVILKNLKKIVPFPTSSNIL